MAAKNKAGEDCTGREYVIAREFDAPRALVFKAWTDPTQVARWWGPKGFTNPVCDWDAQPGKAIRVTMRAPNGVDYPMGGEFREVVPPTRLIFTSGALDASGKLLFEFLHTVTFAERKGRTTLTIRSRVVMATPGANRYIGGFEAGMGQSLVRLADLLATGGAAVVVERTFDAPVAKVWRALTSARAMKKWFFEIKEFQPKVGFDFAFAAGPEGGKIFHHHCRVTEVVREKRLSYSWRFEGYEGDSLVTIELTASGRKTKLRLNHAGIGTFPRSPEFARENFVAGWTAIIGEGLKEFVERQTPERAMDPPKTVGRIKVLMVCARNRTRSLTAEKIFAGSQVYDVKSRGVAKEARIRLTERDLRWADLIFVMEKNHRDRIAKEHRAALAGKKIVCLFIDDLYEPMEKSLIAILREKLAPHLALPKA